MSKTSDMVWLIIGIIVAIVGLIMLFVGWPKGSTATWVIGLILLVIGVIMLFVFGAKLLKKPTPNQLFEQALPERV